MSFSFWSTARDGFIGPAVSHEYVEYYNARRPHQGLEQDSPGGMLPASREGTVRYRKVLGGIIRDYYRAVA